LNKKIYEKKKENYFILYLKDKYIEKQTLPNKWLEFIVKSCYLCRNNENENESKNLKFFDKKIDSNDNFRIYQDPFYLKLYNELNSNALKYQFNIKMFESQLNEKNNQQSIVNEFSKVGFHEILDLLDQIRNGDISNVKSFKLNFENNEFLSEISYFNICKELEQFYIKRLNNINNKLKSKNYLNEDKTEFDIFNPNECRKNRFIIPYVGSIPNPFDKMLEWFDNLESKLFSEYDLSKSAKGNLKYESFEINKIFDYMLRSTVHDSIVLTDMKNKDFLIYLINLWDVILNEKNSSELENNSMEKDVS
jgi:hypothetical protein